MDNTTIMQRAFEIAGMSPADAAFNKAIALYLNSGGTIERARAWLDAAAARMPGMSHGPIVSNDHQTNAQTRQPVEDARGQCAVVDKDQIANALPSSSNRGGGDQSNGAQKSQPRIVSPVREPNHEPEADVVMPAKATPPLPPAREPSPAYLKAAGESRREAARNILYRFKTSDGKYWGDVTPNEGIGVRRDGIRHMALMSACGKLNEKQMEMPYAQLLTPERAQIAMDKADKELVNVA